MTTDNRACKNCISYTDQKKCAKSKTFLTDIITNDGELVITSPHRNSVCVQHQMRKGLPKAFYVRPTTCADCFHFSTEPFEYGATENFEAEVIPAGCDYGNEICTSEAAQSFRPMQASDNACEEHATELEMEMETESKINQEKIEREAAESASARQSEASAERITMQVLGKLRKGGAQ